MPEQLYKVRFRYDGFRWPSDDAERYWKARWPMIQGWLNRHGWRGYVNRYVNIDQRGSKSEMVVVLNDRNTAIMLKLALA